MGLRFAQRTGGLGAGALSSGRFRARLLRASAVGLALWVAASGLAAAADLGPRVPELIVEAEARFEVDAARVAALDPGRLWTAMRLAGLEEPGAPIEVRLVGEDSAEGRAVSGWVAGFARGAAGPVVIFPQRTPRYPSGSLEELLHHEVAHVLIARSARGGPVPRWFHEGVAMAAGSAWGLGDRSRFAVEVLRRGRVPLARVDPLFSGGSAAASRAYAVSGAFVRDLRQRHGAWVSGDILRRVGRGVAFDRAFREATGESLSEAEDRFWRRETFWQRWVPFLTSSFALWIAITLLALVAFRRRRARDAALAARWELEERLELEARQRARSVALDPSSGSGESGDGQPWVH